MGTIIEMDLFRLLRTAFSRARGWHPATLGGRPVRVDPNHLEFWQATTANAWEPRTFEVLREHLNRETTYYDIGAWIGPTVIYAAGLCKQTVCFEPDPIAYQHLLWNIRLNALPNTLPLNFALADRDAVLNMGSMGVLGDSMTTLLKTSGGAGSAKVLALSWQTWLRLGLCEEPDFMKIDIEGSEFSFLPSIKGYLQARKPTIYLSTHTPFLAADQRASEMAKVLEIIAIYKHCLDENMAPVDPQSLLHEEALTRFHSFVLKD